MNEKLLRIKENLKNQQYLENAINHIINDFIFAIEREKITDFSEIQMANNRIEEKFFRSVLLNLKKEKFRDSILKDSENMTISEIAEKYKVNPQTIRCTLKKIRGEKNVKTMQ